MLKALVSLKSRVNSLRNEDGNAAEYGLIIAGVAVAIILVVGLLGDAIADAFQAVVDAL